MVGVVSCLWLVLTLDTVCKASQSDTVVGPPAPRGMDRGSYTLETIIEQNEGIFEEIAEGKKPHFIVDGDIYDPTANESRTRRNAITDRRRLWPGGVVPFIIDGYFSSEQRLYVLSAMQRFHEKTCIQFRPRTIERDYIVITEGEGCWSMIGRRGGRQTVSLGGTCKDSRGTIMHELMHALGFRHEHNRPDRDSYVVLYWQNIDKKMWDNFAKYSRRDVTLLDTGYDYLSLMHYPPFAFSKNGGQTIGTVYPTYEQPGTRDDFSYVDVYRITALYRCGACYDTDKDNCPTWALMSECKRSSVWMHKYCPFSCETCNKADYGGGDCRDYSNSCEKWSSNGECDRNPDFMSYNCKLSCGYCRAPHNIHSRRECYDESPLCSEWSQLGECYNNPKYMKKTCPKSCGICAETERDIRPGDGGVCRDYHPHCERWNQNGNCRSNVPFMRNHCKKSCGYCPTCFDKDANCRTWAKRGDCLANPEGLEKICALSCGNCGNGPQECLDAYGQCPKWAKRGYCSTHRSFMYKFCQVSCNKCDSNDEDSTNEAENTRPTTSPTTSPRKNGKQTNSSNRLRKVVKRPRKKNRKPRRKHTQGGVVDLN